MTTENASPLAALKRLYAGFERHGSWPLWTTWIEGAYEGHPVDVSAREQARLAIEQAESPDTTDCGCGREADCCVRLGQRTDAEVEADTAAFLALRCLCDIDWVIGCPVHGADVGSGVEREQVRAEHLGELEEGR